MFLVARYAPLLNVSLQAGSAQVHQVRARFPAHRIERSGKMHILAIVVTALAGAAVWYWRLKILGEAGREAIDFVGRARGAYRMRKFKTAAEGSVLGAIDDPALAATILLFAISGERPTGSQPAEAIVRFEVGDIVAPEKLDETLAYAEWAARGIADPRDCVRRFTDLWRQALSVEERNDLLEMARNVAGPAPEPHQKLTIEALRNAITYR